MSGTTFTAWAIFGTFSVATLALAVYGLHLYVLLALFRRRAAEQQRRQLETIEKYQAARSPEGWPVVTTQIPIYNEQEVAERVMEAVAGMDYPASRHQVQILDDSTDETGAIIDTVIERLAARGVDVNVVRRRDRNGYKAGALSNGLRTARGQYVAVFDADFVPPPDFLRRAIPLIDSAPEVACIQGRWAHLNREESWLTEAQAMGIDGHFAIEQGARAWNGLMLNFNGTAGVWRRAAIEDPRVGGWSCDTLTEDLDLSYRAQLAGWRLDYCFDLACPAELPGTIAALKSQQRRWATGSIQVACKLLPAIWRSKASLGGKLEATLHLTHYSVAVWMLILALVARPMLLVFTDGNIFNQWFWPAWGAILLSAIAPSMVYAYARYLVEGRWSGFRNIPGMLILGCGICVSNTLAVLAGLVRRGGEFVRTPKSGSAGRTAKASRYRAAATRLWIVELALGVYSLASFVVYVRGEHRVFSVFLLFYAIGFLLIGWMSRPAGAYAVSRESQRTPRLLSTPMTNVEAAPGS